MVTLLTRMCPVVLYRHAQSPQLVMHEAAARSLRTAERFLLAPPLAGHFGASAISVCDISAKGARFAHSQPLEMGKKSVLRLKMEGRLSPVDLEAVVMWTQLDADRSDRFVSGVRTYGSPAVVKGLIDQLRNTDQASRIEELRGSDRFDVVPPLTARWNDDQVLLHNLSARGGRIETSAELHRHSKGILHFDVPGSTAVVSVEAEVAWSALKAMDPSSWSSGVSVQEKPEMLRLAIGHLCEDGRALLDTHSLILKLKIIRARARNLAPSFGPIEDSGVPTEQYILIHSVREELKLNPDEAIHWYRRARLSINDAQTRAVAPTIVNHPDALAVWEYLDRSIDPSLIGRALALPRTH